MHLHARWVYSVDIESFFPSVSSENARKALIRLGYQTEGSLELICRLICLNGRLSQGAPTSPLISNVVLHDVDVQLAALANQHATIFTRYADDIVFSGRGEPPDALTELVKSVLIHDGWRLADHKEELARFPNRLKVHGLLVHGERIRLTKGYRNRIRAYRHLMKVGKVSAESISKVKGHLAYASQIEGFKTQDNS